MRGEKMNETNEKENKAWYMNYTNKEYAGVQYVIYSGTPDGVDEHIKAFIDEVQKMFEHYASYVNISDCEIITENTAYYYFDVWVFKNLLTELDFLPQANPRFIISRKKHKTKNKYGYRIRYINRVEKK